MAGGLAEPLPRIGKELVDVPYRGRREAVVRHRLWTGSTHPLSGEPPEARYEFLQLVIPEIAIPPLIEVGKTRLDHRRQCFQPGCILGLARLDQAQAFA